MVVLLTSVPAANVFTSLCIRSLWNLSALALQYMRSKQVSHMDLKPQNILLSSIHNPHLKIAGKFAIKQAQMLNLNIQLYRITWFNFFRINEFQFQKAIEKWVLGASCLSLFYALCSICSRYVRVKYFVLHI